MRRHQKAVANALAASHQAAKEAAINALATDQPDFNADAFCQMLQDLLAQQDPNTTDNRA